MIRSARISGLALVQYFLESTGELVWAGCAPIITVYASESAYYLADLHPLNEGGYTPQVAVAAVIELDVNDAPRVEREEYL